MVALIAMVPSNLSTEITGSSTHVKLVAGELIVGKEEM